MTHSSQQTITIPGVGEFTPEEYETLLARHHAELAEQHAEMAAAVAAELRERNQAFTSACRAGDWETVADLVFGTIDGTPR